MKLKITFIIELDDSSREVPRTAKEVQDEIRDLCGFDCPALSMGISRRTANTVVVEEVES